MLAYIMLNPSTADADKDDATIRRCIRFSQAEGFSAIEVVNLFAYRATDPRALKRAGYQVGPSNNSQLALTAAEADVVCIAWGVNAHGLARPVEVLMLLRRLKIQPHCLRITRSGYPQHPLMLPTSCRMMPFTPDAIDLAMRVSN